MAYINMPYKKIGVFSQFEKKLSRETEKNPNFVYPGLRYTEKTKQNLHAKFFLESICFSKKFDLRLKKKQKVLGQFQI